MAILFQDNFLFEKICHLNAQSWAQHGDVMESQWSVHEPATVLEMSCKVQYKYLRFVFALINPPSPYLKVMQTMKSVQQYQQSFQYVSLSVDLLSALVLLLPDMVKVESYQLKQEAKNQAWDAFQGFQCLRLLNYHPRRARKLFENVLWDLHNVSFLRQWSFALRTRAVTPRVLVTNRRGRLQNTRSILFLSHIFAKPRQPLTILSHLLLCHVLQQGAVTLLLFISRQHVPQK